MEKGTVPGSFRKDTIQAGSRSSWIKCDKELKKVKTPIRFQMADATVYESRVEAYHKIDKDAKQK